MCALPEPDDVWDAWEARDEGLSNVLFWSLVINWWMLDSGRPENGPALEVVINREVVSCVLEALAGSELGPVGDLDGTGVCSLPATPPLRPEPNEHSEELDIFFDASPIVDEYCRQESGSDPGARASPGSPGKEIRRLSAPAPMLMFPVIL
jgi:hypothetical protein